MTPEKLTELNTLQARIEYIEMILNRKSVEPVNVSAALNALPELRLRLEKQIPGLLNKQLKELKQQFGTA